MYFQALKYKGRNFLDLNNNNNQHIYSTYAKDGAWLKYFSLSNLMCVWCVYTLPDWSQIIPLLVNIGLDSSLKNPLDVCAEIILLR